MNSEDKQRLQSAFSDRVHRDVPIVDFVEMVYNFRYSQIAVNRKEYFLPEESCRQFYAAQNKDESYAPLKNIFDSLKAQLVAHGQNVRVPLELHLLQSEDCDPKDLKSMPTFFLGTQIGKPWTSRSSEACLGFGVCRRSRYMHEDAEYQGCYLNLRVLKKESAQPIRPRPEPETAVSQDVRTLRTRTAPHNATSSKQTSKRKSSSSSNLRDKRPSKRQRLTDDASANISPSTATDLWSSEYDLAQCMTTLMRYGIRSYATAWTLDDTTMKLWYADRMGLVCSKSFDIFEEAHYLVLFLAAITSADFGDLGICHLVKTPSNVFDTYKTMTFEIDEAETDDRALSELKFKILSTSVHDSVVVGRGTTILSLQTINEDVPPTLRGRSIAKIAWGYNQYTPENVTVKAVRQGLRTKRRKDLLKHIVDIRCAVNRTMQEVALPRAFMLDKQPKQRHICAFRCFIMKPYLGLEMVDTVEEFKTVWVDTIRAHRWAFETSGILHHDISIGNLMFYREEGRAIGVLCDWEFAEHTRKKPESTDRDGTSKAPSRRWIGTAEFMAMDCNNAMTSREPPPHLYRFDLESFFWIAVWFCRWFRPERHDFGDCDFATPSYRNILAWKRLTLVQSAIFASRFENTDPTYRELVDTWIKDLRDYLKPLTEHLDDMKTFRELIDYSTTFGVANSRSMSESQARAKLKAIENRWANLITYDGFMRCIGIGKDDR